MARGPTTARRRVERWSERSRGVRKGREELRTGCVTGHVRTEGGHEGSLPPELTYTNVNAHRHVPDPALSSSPREAAHESSRFFFFGYGGRREAAASDARARRTGRRLDSLAETVSNHQPLHPMKIDGGKEAAAIEACARRRRY